ncbi:MFS transporter [Phytomonospora endophytica]|uniref:MFS family permease n=1 Tax=Phytomonospora endophytica TaxID=714109 RepID=A0A841FYX6_9ACTN|nr:MFS transporter [Phytomonospora endophytica]MBB6038722.1 MFS family permease [Phytomonospora endophytica]GIG68482.1 MFS transporter [Phytomonospora endophytica]
MAATPTVPPRTALDEPTAPIARRWLTFWTLANFGLFLAYYATQQILIPRHAGAITADSAGSVWAQSTANVAAAAVGVVAPILIGVFSDRTTHTRGRRQIWVACGAVVAFAGLVAQGLQQTVLGLVLLWAFVQIGLSATTAALNAAVPDEVPVNQRATVSAWFGVAQSLGPLLGIALVALVLTGIAPAYLALGLCLVALAVPFSLGTRGIPLPKGGMPPVSVGSILRGIVAPLRHADFAWAWGGRFLIQLSNALGQIYLYQYLKDRVGFDPDLGTLILVVVYAVAVTAAALPVGRISDRSGRRKRMVVIASVLQGVAGILLAFVPTMPGAIAGAAILGVGFGAYIAVDQALITQVLPRAEDRGKDLGVIQIANTVPYVFAAAVGGVVINQLGGYVTLYMLVLATAVLAALCVGPIKGVR